MSSASTSFDSDTNRPRRRTMSYRKPAPVYIPSPPPSPEKTTPIEAPIPKVDAPVLPLPENWKQVVHHSVIVVASPKRRKDGPLPDLPSVSDDEDDTRVETSMMTHTTYNESRSMLWDTSSLALAPHAHGPRSMSRASSRQEVRHRDERSRRKTHHQYRPPTPPIPSEEKLNKPLPAVALEDVSIVLLKPPATTPRPPEMRMSNSRHLPVSCHPVYHTPAPTAWRRTASSLKISPSFRTEKTLMSLNTDRSRGWPQDAQVTSDEPITGSSTHTLVHQISDMHKVSVDLLRSPDVSCWDSTGLGWWTRKLGSLFIR